MLLILALVATCISSLMLRSDLLLTSVNPLLQKEAFAIFETCRHLNHLLRDRKFIMYTDHKNLLYITERSNPIIYRWWMSTQELDFMKRCL
jgi:hypothetical protein